MSGATVGAKIRAYTGKNVGTVTSFSDSTRSGSDRILTVQVHGTAGTATITGNDLRYALGLKSSLVYINSNLTITGLIRTVYDADTCAPGHPTKPAVTVTGQGRYQTFDNGNIYSQTGGTTLYLPSGAILSKYTALGGVGSILGWPTDPITQITGGSHADFVSGRIYDSDATGAHETHGVVMDEYLDQGGATGSLGFPTSDVTGGGSTFSQTYENGTITCVSGTCTVS